MVSNTDKALVMGKIAHMARGFGLKVEPRDLHLGPVWCKTTGGKYGCVLTLGEDVGVWGSEWTKAIFYNGETEATKKAFIKADNLGFVFTVSVNG